MCGASLPAHGLRGLCAQHPHPHNCLCRWRFWLSCLERRGRSAIPKHTRGNAHTRNACAHTRTRATPPPPPKMHLRVKPQRHDLAPRRPRGALGLGAESGERGAGQEGRRAGEDAERRTNTEPSRHFSACEFPAVLFSILRKKLVSASPPPAP